jgi:hypothetical protein
MTDDSRRLGGILLVVLPSVMWGGMTLPTMPIGDPGYMALCAGICGRPDTCTPHGGTTERSHLADLDRRRRACDRVLVLGVGWVGAAPA